ncbi:MAG: lipopolysaccharide heptosyltransferase family protein, partial [Gammaproteobacteria bacterium]
MQPQRGIGDTLWHLPYLRAAARDAAGGRVLLVTKPSTGARELLAAEPAVGEVAYLRQQPRRPAYLSRVLEVARICRRHDIRRLVILDKVGWPALAGRVAGVPERYGFGTRPSQLRWLTQAAGIDPALHRAHPLEKLPAFAEIMGWGAIDPEPRLPVSTLAATAVAPLL